MPAPVSDTAVRTRRDRCPGVLRPWPADDGALVRVRVVGGRLPATSLAALAAVSGEYADGDLHLTARGNLQLRGVRHGADFVAAVERTGLLPSRRHDQARNVLVSPLSGLDGRGGIHGGRLDAHAIAGRLDRLLLADDRLGDLPGRFLFTLDDGRGDLVDRPTDLGCVALDTDTVQLRVGGRWGSVVSAADAPAALTELAHAFLDARGEGPDAAWHVDELAAPLAAPLAGPVPPDPRVPAPAPPPGAELGPGLVGVPDGVLTPALAAAVTAHGGAVVVTPWHSVVVEELLS